MLSSSTLAAGWRLLSPAPPRVRQSHGEAASLGSLRPPGARARPPRPWIAGGICKVPGGAPIKAANSAWVPPTLCRMSHPGSRTVNTEPLPGSLDTVTSPPIMRANLRERVRPRPVPP
jgi:hypothetical protein